MYVCFSHEAENLPLWVFKNYNIYIIYIRENDYEVQGVKKILKGSSHHKNNFCLLQISDISLLG